MQCLCPKKSFVHWGCISGKFCGDYKTKSVYSRRHRGEKEIKISASRVRVLLGRHLVMDEPSNFARSPERKIWMKSCNHILCILMRQEEFLKKCVWRFWKKESYKLLERNGNHSYQVIATIVMQKIINPETHGPYTISMIERLLHEIHFSVDQIAGQTNRCVECCCILMRNHHLSSMMINIFLS